MPRTIYTSPFPRIAADLPGDVLVVTPHSPAAEVAGRPKVTLQTLARRTLADNGLFIAEPRVAARMLRAAIKDVSPGADAAAMSQRISSVLKTVLRVRIDTAELARLGSRRARELAAIADAFRTRLRAERLVHSEEAVWLAADQPDVPQRVICVYGYTRARAEEVAFINRLAADGSILYMPLAEGHDAFTSNEHFVRQMAGWGWTLDRGTETQRSVGEQAAARFATVSDVQPAAVAALKFHDINCEVRFVLGEVKKLLRSGVPADDIAIVARDLDPYAKEFAAVGGEYGVPTRSSLKIPLAETLLGGLVGLILSAVEKDFAFEQTARLLGHPLGPGMSDETWRRSRRSRVEYYHEWCELEESLKCLDDVRGKTAKPAAEWVKCLRAIFAHFNVRSSAGWIARETVAYNCFQDELSLLADEPETITFAEFSVAVRDVLSVVKTSFDPSRGGVLITEPHVVPGGRFRHVYVLGMAEGLLPALPADNPVIDFHERTRLAAHGIDFEAAADITRWEDLSFFSLISTAAASLTLTYPETVGKEEMLASSYFDKLGLKPENGSAAVLASAAEQLRNILRKYPIETAPMYRPAFRQFEIERRRESAQAHDEFDGVIGEAIDVTGREWSVSQLKTLAGCGFSWFAKYGLRLAPADEMDPEVSASARGSLLHFALDYPVSAGNAKTREDIVGLLDHSLAVGFHDRDVRMPRVRNWDMLRTQYVAELTKAVMAPDFLPEGATIAATEQEFQIGLHGLRVRGRIDRVDRTDQGMTAVDYKTSSRKPDPVKDRDGRKLDLQIAVYLAALRQLYPQMPAIGGAYYSLSARKRFSSDAVDDDVLRAFLEGVTGTPGTGSLPVRPISPDACTFCDYDPLCRKSSRLARKEAAAE